MKSFFEYRQKLKSYWIAVFVLITVFGCSPYAFRPTTSRVPLSPELLEEAKQVSADFWNAQLISDQTLFQEVAHPQMNMLTVFEWQYVGSSGSREFVRIGSIREYLQRFRATGDVRDLGPIEGDYPELSWLLQRDYRDTYVVPENIGESSSCELMTADVSVDVELLRWGRIQQKKMTTKLFRLISDGHDSGWKILWVQR